MPLELNIKENEFWDRNKGEFINIQDTTIHIEHSLASIAKWESRWKKPFFGDKPLSGDELRDYIRCMTLDEGVDPNVYLGVTMEHVKTITAYLEDPMTATWFKKDEEKSAGKKRPGQVMTAEIFYYYMVELGIPFECENWHFNRLATLVRVCSEKQAVPKKMSKKDIFAQNAMLNAKRKARLGTKG